MNDNIAAKFVIDQANDSNGQITSASISYNGHNHPAIGHYHFKNSTGPAMVKRLPSHTSTNTLPSASPKCPQASDHDRGINEHSANC
ncbi:hypothetical protein NLM33_35085 [Bradyrhizobium sp. CCGUVB1N3]|uniref:hypothetical protein n=1 Tax=Bradyrhizobium sp. CCGUVB1N3 TaxID=2949629 RepID=UPI0020B2E1AF|nr:hypothetical protein [Bradyrhizobium sp. CCGUVB1N3]MCP3475518.1 hypothetical protein [Bradyrhizobium sp. CCGUVB1N3]